MDGSVHHFLIAETNPGLFISKLPIHSGFRSAQKGRAPFPLSALSRVAEASLEAGSTAVVLFVAWDSQPI